MTQINEEIAKEYQDGLDLDEILKKDREDAEAYQRRARYVKWIGRLWFAFVILGVLSLAGALLWTGRAGIVPAWDKYETNEVQCVFKVGERTMKATREYSYRYYQILDWKFYDTTKQKEKTTIELPRNAASVLMHMHDGTHERLSIGDAQEGRYPLPQADSYSFFLDNGKNADVVSYQQMCR